MLTPRPVASSVDELLAGATRLGDDRPAEARSGARFERVEVDGAPGLVKYVHADLDFLIRANGDIGCLPRRVWELGLMDAAPDLIDHATLGVAPWGRHGWGAALLMRDVSATLVPAGDDPLPEEHHVRIVDACTGLAARLWGWTDDAGLLPFTSRWRFFGDPVLGVEEAMGWPEVVPRLAAEGWARFAAAAPADVVAAVDAVRNEPTALGAALATTPSTFLHGDWKLGNLGLGDDGRVVLLDWTYTGAGPIAHELGWYLALNRARIPAGWSKDDVIAGFRGALEGHGVATDEWWDRQLGLCLLGATAQFGWEKALGDDRAELGWWIDAARDGLRWL